MLYYIFLLYSLDVIRISRPPPRPCSENTIVYNGMLLNICCQLHVQ